jgi:hypothetical protein
MRPHRDPVRWTPFGGYCYDEHGDQTRTTNQHRSQVHPGASDIPYQHTNLDLYLNAY